MLYVAPAAQSYLFITPPERVLVLVERRVPGHSYALKMLASMRHMGAR